GSRPAGGRAAPGGEPTVRRGRGPARALPWRGCGVTAEQGGVGMFNNLHLLCLAEAAVTASVLFLALLERRNLRNVPVPVLLLAAGAWLWHTGALLVALLSDLT